MWSRQFTWNSHIFSKSYKKKKKKKKKKKMPIAAVVISTLRVKMKVVENWD